jgi:flagellar hook-basal body complex protein FliE
MGSEVSSKIMMDLASIKADAASPNVMAPASAMGAPAHQGLSFAQSMMEALHHVDDQQRAADDKMADVDSGRTDDLVGAMLASQEASLSFSMLMQVRNKVAGAVDELTKLPL